MMPTDALADLMTEWTPVDVTTADIRRGTAASAWGCPVALAASRVLGRKLAFNHGVLIGVDATGARSAIGQLDEASALRVAHYDAGTASLTPWTVYVKGPTLALPVEALARAEGAS